MGLITIPDPVSMFEGAKTAGLEREIINALVSAAYSAWITAMWRSGSAKWVVITGEGQALKDAATAMYLSLTSLEAKNFLSLTVPQDMLDPANTSRFQTQFKSQEKK
jgi:hypothetical protein